MRILSKLRSLDSIHLKNFTTTPVLKFQSFHSKSQKPRRKEKVQDTQMRKPPTETNDFASIFTKITEIIGTANLSSENKDLFGFSVSQHIPGNTLQVTRQHQDSASSVCRIDKERKQLESKEESISEDVHIADPLVNDVSAIVQEITEIIRAEDGVVSMEKQLENAGFVFDPDIVDKVLKRCFKVGHLAIRFFDWLKHRMGFHHTTGTYNTMIYIAGEAREFKLVAELIEEMEKDSCPKDIKTWTILISVYGKAKMIGKALLVFEELRKSGCEPDGKTYTIIIDALCNAGKVEIAMEFYKEMVHKNIDIDMQLYKQLLKCLSRSGDISAVRLVGNDMINISKISEQQVYSCILSSFCISRKIREALELLHELKNKKITLDPGNFEILVKGLCRDGKISDALEIVEIMKRNHIADGKIYGIIIDGYLRRDEVSKAFEMFHIMKESGHIPMVSTYTALLQRLFRFHEYDRACKLYEEMLENGVEPDAVAMTAVVAGHIQQNCISEAWRVLRIMKEKGIKVTQKSYSVFIKELCKISRTDEALELVNEMRDSKINIAITIFNLVISALEGKGEQVKVHEVKQLWRDPKISSQENDYSVIINHQSLCGAVSNQTQFREDDVHLETPSDDVHLEKPPLQVYTDHDLEEICRILSYSTDWSSMQEALEKSTVCFTPELVLEVLRSCQPYGHAALRFFSWLGQQAACHPTTEMYNMALKIAGSAKDFKHMRNLYLEMRRRGCLITPDTWTIIIMQYGRAGLTEIALKVFEEMKSNMFKPNANTYKFLIMVLCEKKSSNIDKVTKTFHGMMNAGFIPDKELVEIYLNYLCKVGQLPDARRCMESIHKCGYAIPLSYSLVVRSLCRVGKLEQALSVAAEMGEAHSTLDQYTYGSLVHGLLRAGRLEEALAKVEAMKQQGINPTVHVYTSLIVHYFKEKQTGEALEIFKKMREEGCQPTIVTFSALIRGYMAMGMVVDARNVFRRMKLKGPYPDFKTYSLFMNCLCKMGRSEEALQLIDEMLDGGLVPSTVNFRTVFYGLNREGKQDLAQSVLQKKWSLIGKRKFST